MTDNPSQSGSTAAEIIVYGMDGQGKPKAGRFPDQYATVARRAARQMDLQVLEVTTAAAQAVAAELPVGRIHANGRGFVPNVKTDLYDRIVAAARDQATDGSPATGSDGTTSSEPRAAALAPQPAPGIPQSWEEIAPGHLVPAHEGHEWGWWEAIVLERTGDLVTVRWRDYPKQKPVMRHISALALVRPSIT